MKIIFKIMLSIIFFFSLTESKANTLLDSLNSAYKNNPILNAERANMRATIEEKREAASEFLPSITISGFFFIFIQYFFFKRSSLDLSNLGILIFLKFFLLAKLKKFLIKSIS